MKISATTFFDKERDCWRVRFRAPGLDTKFNVPDDVFDREGVSPKSESKRAENVAVEWAVTKRAELLRPVSGTPMSLRQVFDLMKSVNPDAVTSATWARNDIHIRNLERLPENEPLGKMLPDQIDGRLAAMYRNERLKEAASRTVAGELTFLVRLLRFGYEEAAQTTGMTGLRLTTIPKILIEEEEMVALTIDQFFKVVEAARKMKRDGGVTARRLIFGVTSLLRKTPLMGLCYQWVDLDDAWLSVPASAQKGRRGEKRPLEVPLCGWSLDQTKKRMDSAGYVWPNSRSGEPVGNVTHTLDDLALEAGVPRFSLHDLRATGNTWLANAGVDERIRQYLMGHIDGGPVISRYTKITSDTEKQLRDAVAVFDDIRAGKENVASIHKHRRRSA